ncbi:MAG: fucose isomerase [Azospirillaceae bacterium]|nr:fucose isomerase [Azospirillaceae bacterium]
MNIMHKRPTFGVIIGTRNFFNDRLALSARSQILAQFTALNYDVRILPVDATKSGAVETREDARRYARYFGEHRDAIDGIVVVLPNFGDELGIVQTLEMANLRVPVLVQACNDDNDKVSVTERRDAFCGKFSVCNNLYQYGIPFTDTTSHTSDLDSDEFRADLRRFAGICRTVKGLKTARIGAIGARTAPFQTVRCSEKLLQASGITVITVDLSEILAAAQRLDADAADVKTKLAAIEGYGVIASHIKRDNVIKQARLSVAIDHWMAANECDASCIQCWTSVQDNYGCATCLSMSMMGQALMPSACEVDIAGAVSMYALLLASGHPPALLDWNNNFARDADKCVCTHCGNFPKDFLGVIPQISELDVLGETIGREKCFGAVKGKVAAGPMSFLRVSTDDRNGTIRSYFGEGAFTDDPYGMDGGIAVTQVADLRGLLRHICRYGFEHHVAMVRGHYADVVEEALSTYLSWTIYRHPSPAIGLPGSLTRA